MGKSRVNEGVRTKCGCACNCETRAAALKREQNKSHCSCRDASEYFLIHSHRRRFIFIGACIACRRADVLVYHRCTWKPGINHFYPRADCNSRHRDDETPRMHSLSAARMHPISIKRVRCSKIENRGFFFFFHLYLPKYAHTRAHARAYAPLVTRV